MSNVQTYIRVIKDRTISLFCKHRYVEMIAISPFQCISGERIYIVCDKCGKVKDSYFKKHE